MDATDSGNRPTISLDIFAALVSIVSYWCSLQRYGVYDYFDGIRYLASGVALLVDGAASPIPIAYQSNAVVADFVAQQSLNYPSIPFQLWAAVTTGLGSLPLVATSIAAVIFYIIHNIAFARVARQFLPLKLTVAALAMLCFAPSIFVRTMTRPLPDSFLCMTFTLGLCLALSRRPISAGVVAGLGSVVRFQGLLFAWSLAFLNRTPRSTIATLVAFAAVVGVTSVLLSLVSAGLHVEKSASNFGFYLNLMSPELAAAAVRKIPADLMMTVSALLAVREFVVLLLSVPVIGLAIFLSSNRLEKSTLTFFLLVSLYIAFFSYHVMTVTLGSGHDARYIVYTMPLLVLADFVSLSIIARRLNILRPVALVALGVMALYGLSVVYYAARMDPLLSRDYLPESALSFIGPDKTIALAASEEAASELYIVTKARHLMWLPEDPAQFTAGINPTVDYLLVGGYWNSPYDAKWSAVRKLDAPIRDAGGNEFRKVAKTAYYDIYARSAGATP